MGTPITVVDAFADEPFSGNPAAVCVLDAQREARWMAAVAAEVNLPMTAFASPRSGEPGHYDLRWFTPTTEVSLCGHVTVATTHVLGGEPTFHTSSGLLVCRKGSDGTVEMDFPALTVEQVAEPPDMASGLGVAADRVLETWFGGGWWLIELAGPADVRGAQPDAGVLLGLGDVVVIAVAAPGDDPGIDSVCRVFQPAFGLAEDPVTGSAHCIIGPWLAARTGRREFSGLQASSRGGRVGMRLPDGSGERVLLSGRAVTVLQGELAV